MFDAGLICPTPNLNAVRQGKLPAVPPMPIDDNPTGSEASQHIAVLCDASVPPGDCETQASDPVLDHLVCNFLRNRPHGGNKVQALKDLSIDSTFAPYAYEGLRTSCYRLLLHAI